MKRLRLLLPFGIAVTAFMLFCSDQKQAQKTPEPSPKSTKPLNVVLISMDTVRADYLGVYNAQGAATPQLERIASQGILFEKAIAQVPFTLPSHCSLFTGTYPMFHNVQENGRIKLSGRFTTLAEIFHQNGYQTAAFIAAFVLQAATGLAQGFDYYDDALVTQNASPVLKRSADSVNYSFRKWYATRNTKRPYFAFVHFYDAHAPYDPPNAFRPKVESPEALYKGEISYVDQTIGLIFDTVTTPPMKEDTLILIVGDHGEMLGEHGESGHGYYIYQPALHVPLILYAPGLKNKGLKIKPTVQIVDVMPSLIDMLKLRGDTKQIQGTSFIPLISIERGSTKPAYSESLTATDHFGAVPLRSIQDDRYKFIQTARSELYDLQQDPSESKNLLRSEPDQARKMEQELTRLVRAYSRSPAVDVERISSDAQEQLAALGYVSSGASTNPAIHLDRDPKDFLEMWNKLNILGAAEAHGDNAETRRLISEFRRSGVVPTLVALMDAKLLIRQNRLNEAESIIKDAIREDDRNLQALTLSGEVYEKRGKLDEAVVFYRRVVELEISPAALETFIEQMKRLRKPDEVPALIEWIKKSGKWNSAFVAVLKK